MQSSIDGRQHPITGLLLCLSSIFLHAYCISSIQCAALSLTLGDFFPEPTFCSNANSSIPSRESTSVIHYCAKAFRRQEHVIRHLLAFVLRFQPTRNCRAPSVCCLAILSGQSCSKCISTNSGGKKSHCSPGSNAAIERPHVQSGFQGKEMEIPRPETSGPLPN